MIKKYKLLSLPMLAVSTIPFITLSAAGDTDDKENKDKQPTPAPQKISDNFSTFRQISDDTQKQIIDDMLKLVQGFLQDELLKIQNDDKTEYKQKLSKVIYFSKLKEFFENNKEKIKTNPDQFGFYVTFPNVLAREKEYANGSVTLNNKKFNGVIFGIQNDEKTKYDRALGPEASKKEANEANYVTDKEFEETIKSYRENLLSKIKSIIAANEDVLQLDDKIFLENKDINSGSQKINGFFVSNPKDFDNWDSYFISKIKPRFLEYDLTQNQQFTEQQQQKKNQQNKPPTKPILPLIPDKAIKNPNQIDQVIEAIPALSPQIKSQYTNLDFNNLSSLMSSNNSEDIFFFNNPINTRYVYKVNSITKDNDQNIATVSVKDLNDTKIERIYKQEFEINNTTEFKNRQSIYSKQIDVVKNLSIQLYKSLGLDEKLKYEELGEENLISNVFGLVDAFTKLIHSDDYVKAQEDFINNYQNTNNFENDLDNILSKSSDYISELFLDATSSIKFEDISPWTKLAKTFENILDIYKTEFYNFNKEIVIKNFNTTNQDIHLIDKLMKIIEKDIFRLISLSNSKSYSRVNWFNGYTNLLSKITNNFKNLRDISTIKEIDDKNQAEFLNSIEVTKNTINENTQNLNNKKTVISSIILSISFIIFIVNITLMLIFKKTLKNKKILLAHILLFTFIAILFITSIVLLLI
ncbi:MSC_0620 family F1-like ATPase-associated subunit [Mycoplasma miroungirhinis]|uniref:Transmembrane protein n=1 Tax=Mycoplasma miroungirhinis TaxID=754516 RepID=A0A6M4JCV4_9MOLU|nr:hypothetical protein [Mycoplasma miroungirhinis]QJR44185.1 hypothetical protein HLA92_01935 [Mycoplasma miroungirhinis]